MIRRKFFIIFILFINRVFLFPSDVYEWKKNLLNSSYIYGMSEITEINDDMIFYADLPVKKDEKNFLKINYRRFEFGMMYDHKDHPLQNYKGSFLVRLIKSDETEFSFIARLGEAAVYLNGDDYETFYFPESFYGEHVKVIVKVLTDEFPDYIDKVIFYLSFPRSK